MACGIKLLQVEMFNQGRRVGGWDMVVVQSGEREGKFKVLTLKGLIFLPQARSHNGVIYRSFVMAFALIFKFIHSLLIPRSLDIEIGTV